MTDKDQFTHEEWIICQSLTSFLIKMAIQMGGDVNSGLKLAQGALRERGLAAKTSFARTYFLWQPTPEEEKERGEMLSGRDYGRIVNRSLEIFRDKLREDELDEIRRTLFYVSENVSRIGLRGDADIKGKMIAAQALFDQILAFGIDDINKIRNTVAYIQGGGKPPA